MLELSSAMLSIVLAHQYQKDEFIKVTEGTPVNFYKVRDTMYRYSKKAEEKFLECPCFAFLFYQFARSPIGQQYIKDKKGADDKSRLDDRTEQEIEQMSNEALVMLQRSYDKELKDLILHN